MSIKHVLMGVTESSLEKPLLGARCLSQDSAAISALWVTTALKPGEHVINVD